MAITAAQRSIALQAIVTAAVAGDASVNALLPGVTAAQVLTALVTALGTTQDANLTTICGSLATRYQTELTEMNAVAANQQAAITAVTVV